MHPGLTIGRPDTRVSRCAWALDLFTDPNVGPPGHVVGTPRFGKFTRTRLPAGGAGSSPQIQLAVRLTF